MTNSCIICGDENSGDVSLVSGPCEAHHFCGGCLEDAFRLAMKDEKHYPPRCCNQIFLINDYDDKISEELLSDYITKEYGEYSIAKRYRVYCSNVDCTKFLPPHTHVDDVTKYAVCDGCTTVTCVKCATNIPLGADPADHECAATDEDGLFKATAQEEGYQECFSCGSTVELSEACNHISCGCGASFCYVCGKQWETSFCISGCPLYGKAIYDNEGYNQDGFHRDTGKTRDGLTARQVRAREDGEDDIDEDEDVLDEDDENAPWPPDMDPELIAFLNQLPPEERMEVLEAQRIMELEDAPELNGEEMDEVNGEDEDEEDEADKIESDAGEQDRMTDTDEGDEPQPSNDEHDYENADGEESDIADAEAQPGQSSGIFNVPNLVPGVGNRPANVSNELNHNDDASYSEAIVHEVSDVDDIRTIWPDDEDAPNPDTNMGDYQEIAGTLSYAHDDYIPEALDDLDKALEPLLGNRMRDALAMRPREGGFRHTGPMDGATEYQQGDAGEPDNRDTRT